MKKVSVVVPFYNSKKTIRKCVESILSSTYENFELVCVNDGGTDESFEIIKSYNDPRIKLIDNTHGGVSKARNRGLMEASGDYIQFVDSDDHIEPTMIEKMVNALEREDACIAVCNYTHPSIKNYLSDCVIDITDPFEALKYYQTTFAAVVPWNKLYKKEVLKHSYDEEVSFCEDDLFGISNLFNAKKLVSISDVLYHYYVAPADEENLSCINAMAKSDKFWETKNTYWYKRDILLQKTINVLNDYLPNNMRDDFAYARHFDFMIWEILILNCVGVDLEGLRIEVNNIFREERFKYALSLREKYGLKFKEFNNDEEFTNLVNFFVDETVKMQNEFNDETKFRPFYLSVMLFIKLFMEPISEVNNSDILSDLYIRLCNNTMEEAKYINNQY